MVDELRRLWTKSQSSKRLTTAMIAVDLVRNVPGPAGDSSVLGQIDQCLSDFVDCVFFGATAGFATG
jgi:hypothetical protein